MNSPFYYQPDELCQKIAAEVIADIESREEWREEMNRGKMFGILVYDGGYLKAYSGQIMGRSDWEGYVPAVFDYLQEDGYFKKEEAEIVLINKEIERAPKFPRRGGGTYVDKETEALKQERKRRSIALQTWLFEQFRIINSKGEARNLMEIFADWAERTGSKCILPPSGSGECCAPKLLQYAFTHDIKPLTIAEFWYQTGGHSNRLARISGNFYGACQSRCKPILDWMLRGVDYEGNELDSQDFAATLDVLYEDSRIIAVDKPAGMLSVPGKSQRRSAYDILREMRPECEQLMMAHRLDMQTSGVLVAAKDIDTYRFLQRIFADKTAASEHDCEKIYYAELESSLGKPIGTCGEIALPLAADYLNRPCQCVDYENGKLCLTLYEVVDEKEGRTILKLQPVTGRTHQLRVHCAHPDGLGVPILGDELYGHRADRLHLHASRLKIDDIVIESKADFYEK